MKVENMLKLKEEFDYKSMCRRLEIQLDKIIAEHERQQKAFEDEVERVSLEAQNRIAEIENEYAHALEVSCLGASDFLSTCPLNPSSCYMIWR